MVCCNLIITPTFLITTWVLLCGHVYKLVKPTLQERKEMATPIHEKQRRGLKYFFRSSSKNYVPKSEPDDVVMMPSKSPTSDMLSRKSKNYAAKPEPDDVVIMPSKSPMSENVMLSRKSRDFQETVVVVGGRRREEMEDIGRGGGKVVKMVEARKSVSHVETNLTSAVSFLQVKVLVSDMPGFMQVHAFRCARTTYDSLEQFSSKHIAYNMKKEFDKVYGPAWHCIVGSNFGSYVTHSTGCFLYFSMEKLYILVFKTKVQKAKD